MVLDQMKSFSPERSLQVFNSSRPQKIGFLMVLTFLSSPYFFLRMHGFDYQQGGSLTLVDVLLLCAGLKIVMMSTRASGSPRIKMRYVSAPLLLVGSLFTMVSLFSGLEALLIYNIDVSIGPLFSGTIQYAFIFLFLPIIASHYLFAGNLIGVIRVISLAHLLPMILTVLLLASQIFPESLRAGVFSSGRAIGTYGNANSFAAVLLIVLPYYATLFVTERGFWKLIGLLGVNLTIICLALTISFSGMLILICLVLGNLILSFLWRDHPINKHRSNSVSLALLSGLILTMTAGMAVTLLPGVQETFTNRIFILDGSSSKVVELESFGSADQRLDLIDTALNLIRDRDGGLFSGHGMRQTEHIPAFSLDGTQLDVHLIYLLLWIEGGFMMLLLYIAYLLLMVRNVIKLAKISPSGAVAVGTSLLAIILFGMVNPHLYLRYFWIPILPAFVNWNRHIPKCQKKQD